jgi:hypothetical protein
MVTRQRETNNSHVVTDFAIGHKVRFVGLQRNPELNGRSGVVKRFHEECGVYEVLPSTRGRDSLVVNPSNLANASKTDVAKRISKEETAGGEIGNRAPKGKRSSSTNIATTAKTKKVSARPTAKKAAKPVVRKVTGTFIESNWVSIRKSRWPGRARAITMDDDF